VGRKYILFIAGAGVLLSETTFSMRIFVGEITVRENYLSENLNVKGLIMANYNKVMILGNLTRDVEVKCLTSGTSVGEFGIAVNRRIKKNEEWIDETTFVDVTVWGTSSRELCKVYR